MLSRFRWTTFNLNGSESLPPGWEQGVRAVAKDADVRDFPRTPVVSREGAEVQHVARGRVHADQVRERLPWLYQGYRDVFLEMASEACAEPVAAAKDDRYGVVLNVQSGTRMRFECHVDSNPLSGVLFFTDHAEGGELVIGHDTAATDISAVDRDCSVIRPQAGYLVFFQATEFPHYARSLVTETDVRIAAVMNYYTESRPESARPTELNRHLYGD